MIVPRYFFIISSWTDWHLCLFTHLPYQADSLFLEKWQVHSDYYSTPHLLPLSGVKSGLGYSHNSTSTLLDLLIQESK